MADCLLNQQKPVSSALAFQHSHKAQIFNEIFAFYLGSQAHIVGLYHRLFSDVELGSDLLCIASLQMPQ